MQEESVWNRIFKASSSIRRHGRVCIDSSTVEAKRGRYDRLRWIQA